MRGSALLAALLAACIGYTLWSRHELAVAAPPERQAADRGAEAIAPYQPRFGRARPVVAVIGENAGTEVTDYVVPYGVLAQSGAAEVVAVATQPGPIQLMPALAIEPEATIEAFDARFPQGADYLIVPAVHRPDDPVLLAWVGAQAAKGATLIGVCDGAWVLANAGLLKDHRATGHWYSLDDLERKFGETRWIRNRRYVADGRVVTSTGVTASIPVSLALVEAVAGRDRATAVANKLGAADWSPTHQSADFRLGARQLSTAARNLLSLWSHEEVWIEVSPGTDEIALALTADAYSRTYRSQAFSVAGSREPIRTLRGLKLIPDRVADASRRPDRMLPPPASMRPVLALDRALADIAEAYGPASAAFVALQLEYPNREGAPQ